MASEVKKEKEMLKADLYGIVGVDRNASDAEIKKAYRSKSRKLHPDRNKAANAAELFHQLKEELKIRKFSNLKIKLLLKKPRNCSSKS